MGKKDKVNVGYTHMDYRNAKVIHMVEKEDVERYIYRNEEISKEEADRITDLYFAEKDKRKKQEENVR